MRGRSLIAFGMGIAVGYVVTLLLTARDIRQRPTEWRRAMETVERDVHQEKQNSVGE